MGVFDKYLIEEEEEEKSVFGKYFIPTKPQSLIEGLPMSLPSDKPTGTTITQLPSQYKIKSLSLKDEYTPKPKEPTWGDVVKHSLKSGLGQFQASLVNLMRLIDMGVTKLTDPIQNIIPIDPEKAKAFKKKYGVDPNINTTEMLTKIVEDSEKIAAESGEKAKSKQWLKKLVGTGLKATPQIVGATILGAGMPVVGGIAAAKPTAEIITRVTQMIPFGLSAMGGQARQIEQEYEALGKEAPYYAMVIGGALSGVGEMATELPVFMGVARMLKGGGKAIINKGAKTLIDKYGKLGIEYVKNVALQASQEAWMVPIEKGVKQAIGLPQDWSIEPLVKEMGENAYGGMAMALVLGGLGGSIAGSKAIADKTGQVIDNAIRNKENIRETLRKVAEAQGIIPEMPEAVTLGKEVEVPKKISDKEISEIGNIVENKLKNMGIETEQIHFVGSEVTGKAKPISDIDIYIVPKNKDLWKTQEEYNELIKRIDKALPDYKGRKIDIILEKDFEPRGWETKIVEGRIETSFKEQPIKTYKPKAPAEVAEVVKEPEFTKDIKIKDVFIDMEKGVTLPKKVKHKGAYSIDEIFDIVLKSGEQEAKKAFSEGKREGRIKQKENFENILKRAKEREAQKKYVNKLVSDVRRLPTQNMAVDYKEMIEDIKSEFDFKRRTAKTLLKRQRLAEFIERQSKLDYDVDVPQEQIDLIRKKPLNEMTIEELETVHDNIMHLAHLGKTKNKLLKVAAKRDFKKQRDILIDTVTKGKPIEFVDRVTTGKENKTFFEKIKEAGQIYHYNTVRAERLFEQADNYKEGGEFWATFFKPINDATYEEADAHDAQLSDFRAFLKEQDVNVGKLLYDKIEVNERVILTPSEKIEVFLATFDKDKMRHLIRGNKFTEKDIDDVMGSITPKEKAIGNYLINHYDEQYKSINEIYKQLTGKNLPKIPGYSPIRMLTETIEVSKDVIESLLTKYNVRPSIRKGFTKERTKGAIQPLNLDAVGNYLFNLSKTEHYKAFVLPIRDINKLLSDPQLIEAIKNKKGNPFYQNLKAWLLDVSDTNPGLAFDHVDKIARMLRTHAADAMLGFNVVSAMKQPISLLNAAAEIGISNVLNGITQLAASPRTITAFVYKKSPLVRNRKGQFDRVISELEQSKTIKQLLTKATTKSDVIIGLLKFMDQQSVKAVWKGAYDQALGKNMTDEQAIEYADRVVRRTQPMAGVKDLAKWFRGGTLSKMFTMFQNQINNNYNYYTHDILGKYRAGEIGAGKVMYRVAFSYMLPALLMGMISRGRLPKDTKEALKDLISFPIAGLFFIGSMVRNMIQGWDGFNIPPLSWANDVMKIATVKKARTKIKYGLSGLAKVLGIPWNQPYRSVKGMIDYLGGSTDDLRRLIWSEYALDEKKKVGKAAKLESFEKYTPRIESVFNKYLKR